MPISVARARVLRKSAKAQRTVHITSPPGHAPLSPIRGDTALTRFTWTFLASLIVATFVSAAELPKPMVAGLKNPESACIGLDGRVYVTIIGGDQDGDGSVV